MRINLKIIVKCLGIILKNATIIIPFIEGVLNSLDSLRSEVKKNSEDILKEVKK